MTFSRKLVIGILVAAGLLWTAGFLLDPSWSPPAGRDTPGIPAMLPPSPAATAAVPAPAKRVAAKVNGEPIYENDLAVDMPKDSFTFGIPQARAAKLQRLIEAVSIRQFLKKEAVDVSEAEVDAEVQALRKTPPAAGCACCRFQSLEQFMQSNAYDMKELRLSLANDLGFQKYLQKLWEQDCPPGEKRDERVRAERPRIEKEYVRVSHIFFNTFQDPDFEKEPDKVRKVVGAKANAAWERLRKGASFESVAREISEDAMSGPQGGALGCVAANAFGQTFEKAIAGLRTGEYSSPVESAWGYHVIRREAMSDGDVLDIVKSGLIERMRGETLYAIRAATQVGRIGGRDGQDDDSKGDMPQ